MHQGRCPSTRWTQAPRFHGDERQHPFGGGSNRGHTRRFCCRSCTSNHTLDLCCIGCYKMAARSSVRGEEEENSCRTPLERKKVKRKHDEGAAASPERLTNQQDFRQSAARNARRHEQISIKYCGFLLFFTFLHLGGTVETSRWTKTNKCDQIKCCNPKNKERYATGLLSLHKHGCYPA